jgi:hypothetical protein
MSLPVYHPYKNFPPVLDKEIKIWTPMELDVDLFLNSRSLGKFTLNGSSLVEKWEDDFGGSFFAEETTEAYRPTRAVVSDVPCVSFDNTDDRLITNYKTNGGSYTLFFVLNRKSTSAQDCVYAECDSSSNSYGASLLFYNTSIEFGHAKSTSGDIDAVTATAPIGKSIVCAIRENGVNHTLWADGTLLGTTACSSLSATSSFYGQIGHNTNYTGTPARPFDGDIAAVLFIPFVISAEVRQKLEGWAAWEYYGWDLLTKLPSDHPYKHSLPILESSRNLDYFTAMNLEGR